MPTSPNQRSYRGGNDGYIDCKSARLVCCANLISKKPYRGINMFLLALQGYGSQYWLTFNQAK
jgi:antirestriction protein ArdC